MEGLGQVQRQKSRQRCGATREEAALRDSGTGTPACAQLLRPGIHRLAHPVASLARDFHLAFRRGGIDAET